MTAWWIYLSTSIFGNSVWAIRLPAVLAHLFLLYKLGTQSESKAILVYLLFTPLSFFGAVLMTPDIPLLIFWLLYFIWCTQIHSELSAWNDDPVSRVYRQKPVHLGSWVVGGILLGLGLLSKYTMGLAPICLGLLLLTKYRLRAWYQGFLAHLCVGFLLFLPVLLFNYQNGFSPLAFQWAHMQQTVSFNFLYTFLGAQIALVGALPFLLLPWLAINYCSLSRIPAFRAHTFFFLIPLAFFLFKSTHHFLEANWGLVSYVSFWPLSSFFIQHNSFRVLVRSTVFLSFVVPLTISGVICIHLFHPLGLIKISQDRFAKLNGQNQLIKDLSQKHNELKNLPVFLTSYQWTSYFRFYGFSSAQQLPDAGRPSHFTLKPSEPCIHQKVLFFHPAGETTPKALECFQEKKVLTEAPLIIRNQTASNWELIELSKSVRP